MVLTRDDSLLAYVFFYFGKCQAIKDTDEYGDTILLNPWYPVGFAHWYEDILQSIPFKRADYDKHERLQELLEELNLNKESFWGLVLYLYDYVTDACKNLLSPQKTHKEILNEFLDFLSNNSSDVQSITLKTADKSYTLSDRLILDFLSLDFKEDLMSESQKWKLHNNLVPLSAADKADSRRKTSYFFAQSLAAFLQIPGISSAKRRQGANLSNKEKELILCLLYVCKFADNPENYLDLGYFNKLMKDFKGLEMNISHKYELEIPIDWTL